MQTDKDEIKRKQQMLRQEEEGREKKKLEEIKKEEEEQLVEMLASTKYQIPYINLTGVPIENEALRVIPESEAKELLVAPFKIVGKNIDIAVHSPAKDGISALLENLASKNYHVSLYMASLNSLNRAWERYAEISMAKESRAGSLDISGDTILSIAQEIHSINDVRKLIEDLTKETKTHKISKMLEIIMAGAISVGASDVHVEAEEERGRLRFRLDGVLQDIMFFGLDIYKMLNTRLKLLAGMKLVSNQQAQDGRFSIFVKEDEISIRASMIPGSYGESIVMRILNPKSIRVPLEALGMQANLFELTMKEIGKPNGMILITGPTGSGKTTTLYAFLQKIYSPDIKIITIEDPVEYHLPGITQTQTESDKGYTFLEGLRSSLRQDPDVIMVGEIRDDETAKIAVESALTGHMVFSTLHTNNAAGVIPRLIELKVNSKILVSALSLSLAQRLVRKLCENCKREKTPTNEEVSVIKKVLEAATVNGKDFSRYGIDPTQQIKLWEAPGCEKCNSTGYKGQIGVFEAIFNDEAISDLIPQNPSEREIKKVALSQGLLDMKEDGVVKILKGVTSLAEVQSVVDFDKD